MRPRKPKSELKEDAALTRRYNAQQKARIDDVCARYPQADQFCKMLRRITLSDASVVLLQARDLVNLDTDAKWTMLRVIGSRATALREAAGMDSFGDPIERDKPSFIERVKKEMGI